MTDGEGMPAPSGLSWGVRASFVGYVRDSGGLASAEGGAVVSPEGMGSWALADDTGFDRQAGRGTLAFAGEVRFLAHFGALDVRIADPVVRLDGKDAELTTSAPSGPLALARFAVAAAPAAPGYALWVGREGALTADAAFLFGGAYAAGAEMDPFVIALSEGSISGGS